MKTIFALALALLCAEVADGITIDTIPVGNPGNPADTTGDGFVPYDYRIGKYEVTNSQYVGFLNAVDPRGDNRLSLYSNLMTTDGSGGINLTAAAANGFKYSVKFGRGDMPVIYVSWYDAIRFVNWLHNGQGGPGTTEDGAYTLLGGTTIPSNTSSIIRRADARWWMPNENEWYKAAYHKNDGATANYWDYPTSADSEPFSDQPPGNGAPDPSNTANFLKDDAIANGYDDGFAITGSLSLSSSQNYLSNVGSYPLSSSPYGTFDQGGSVFEWIETRISSDYGIRGGSWHNDSSTLHASTNAVAVPSNISQDRGFRVATLAVPEPAGMVLFLAGLMRVIFSTHFRRRRTTPH